MKKICVICKDEIIEKKDRWVRLTDFNRGKQVSEVFYHLDCWRDRFRISNTKRKKKMYKQTQQAIGNILRVINPNPQKIVEIR